MHSIEVFIESHWAVKRPELIFKLNEKEIHGSAKIVDQFEFQENIIHRFEITNFNDQNTLEIELVNKTHDMVTEQSDHWIEIKNINVDQVAADWLLFEHTKFKHKMSDQWVLDMKTLGLDIEPEYCPGTQIRLNGIFTFEFHNPFLIQRVVEDWQKNI